VNYVFVDEIEVYKNALEKEIIEIKRSLRIKGVEYPLKVIHGEYIENNGEGFIFKFKIDDLTDYIPSDTDVSYEFQGARSYGYVIESFPEKDEILVILKEFIGDEVEGGELRFDLSYLLHALSDALDDVTINPEKYNIKMINDLLRKEIRINHYEFSNRYSLNEAQYSAVKVAVGSNICIVWGPPGTGKTTTIGAIVNELVQNGYRILVLSHTNLAVDTLMNKIHQYMIQHNENYRLLRHGIPTQELKKDIPTTDKIIKEILSRNEEDPCTKVRQFIVNFFTPNEIERSSPLFLLKSILQKDIPKSIRDMVKKCLSRIDFQMAQYIRKTDVIGTTLTRLYLDEKFMKKVKGFEVAIIDEVTTALIPQIIYAASQISKKLIMAGDFNQLQCIANTSQLKTNIFRKLQLDCVEKNFQERPMLNVQYRMHPDICAIINQLFYGGKLRTSTHILNEVNIWPKGLTKPIGACLLFDSSGSNATCLMEGATRKNIIHAKTIINIIDYLIDSFENQFTIGIITPYRGQSNLLKRKIARSYSKLLKEEKIGIGTVHSFQGQEKDIIIFDLVDAPLSNGRYYVGFLNDYENPELPNLINVAISRAKKKLIVIAHQRTFERAVPSGIVMKLLNRVKRWGFVYPLEDIDNTYHFVRNIKEWPPTKRLFSISELQRKLQDVRWIEWGGKRYPLMNIKQMDCIIEIKGKERRIPIYEVEAINKKGVKENIVLEVR